MMVELKCDRCGKNCGLNASVIDIRVVHNPNPVRFGDIGEIRLTDDNTRIRYMLCQSCYDKQGLPNPYRTGEKLAEEIKNSGVVHAEWIFTANGLVCSHCETNADTDGVLTPYCSFCGAKMKIAPVAPIQRKKSEEMEETGYYDEVGGYHISATGYAPTGEYCGECTEASCKNCPTAERLSKKTEKEMNDDA